MVPQRPFLIGSPGCVRSSAWIWLFSSAQSTIACSGGLRYSPTIASSFSANSGSLLTLKVRDKCGFRPCLCQMRRTLFSLSPAASAIVRVLQWVALTGFSCVVLRTTSCTLAGVIVGVRPGRGASFSSPAKPIFRKRFRHTHFSRNLQILFAGCCQQDNACSLDLPRRQRSAPCPLIQGALLVFGQDYLGCHTHVI